MKSAWAWVRSASTKGGWWIDVVAIGEERAARGKVPRKRRAVLGRQRSDLGGRDSGIEDRPVQRLRLGRLQGGRVQQ